jgi:hypothetical protein
VPLVTRKAEAGRPVALGLSLAVAFAVCCTGCAERIPELPKAPTGPTYVSPNGLLYPPELWGALDRSFLAQALHAAASLALGGASSLRTTPGETFQALQGETSEVEAAYLTVTLTTDGDGTWPWGSEQVSQWWESASLAGMVDSMWMADRIAEASGRRLEPSESSLKVLSAAVDSQPFGPVALDLLQRYRPMASGIDPTPQPPVARGGRDAALLLLHSAQSEGRSPDELPALLRVAQGALLTDDWAYSFLVRAYAAVGRTDRAELVAAVFDRRRVLPGGEILEVPSFDGTVGSTFRMVRYLNEAGETAGILDGQKAGDLSERVQSLLNADEMHLAAGTATLALLVPSDHPHEERAAAIQAISDQVGDDPLSVSQAFAWTYVAEYASTMGVPLDFPGLANGSANEWIEQIPAGSAWPIARFLLGLHDTGNAVGDPDVPRLTAALRKHLAATEVKDLPSTALFTGELAVHAVTGQWVHDPAMLLAEADARWGSCIGGYDNFVRETRAPSDWCNADASLQVLAGRAIWAGQGVKR